MSKYIDNVRYLIKGATGGSSTEHIAIIVEHNQKGSKGSKGTFDW